MYIHVSYPKGPNYCLILIWLFGSRFFDIFSKSNNTLGSFWAFFLSCKDVLVFLNNKFICRFTYRAFYIFLKNSWAFQKIECQSQSPREWALPHWGLGPTLRSTLWGPHYPTKTKPQILKVFEHFK